MTKSYVEKVDSMNKKTREIVRASLAELAEWITQTTQLRSYTEVRKFLHEMLDVSV